MSTFRPLLPQSSTLSLRSRCEESTTRTQSAIKGIRVCPSGCDCTRNESQDNVCNRTLERERSCWTEYGSTSLQAGSCCYAYDRDDNLCINQFEASYA
jgi:hypothetical protein